MSNALTALNKEYWASQLQEVWFKENVARALSDTHYEAVLSDGDTLNLPYTGFPQVQTYTKDTAVTPDSRYSTSEALSVDTTKIVPSLSILNAVEYGPFSVVCQIMFPFS